jgi:hypothetical protein
VIGVTTSPVRRTAAGLSAGLFAGDHGWGGWAVRFTLGRDNGDGAGKDGR